MRGLTHWLVNCLGELAFTLLGVDFNERTGEARFLIMVAHPRRGIRARVSQPALERHASSAVAGYVFLVSQPALERHAFRCRPLCSAVCTVFLPVALTRCSHVGGFSTQAEGQRQGAGGARCLARMERREVATASVRSAAVSSAAVKSAAANRWRRASGRESTTRRDRCLNREEPRGAEGSRDEPRGAEY